LASLKRLGVFGGAFDPPHLAHLALAKVAIEQLALDQLRLIPTGQAGHKARPLTASKHRVAMTRLAFAELAQALVDTREIEREGVSYTVETLRELRQEYPQASLWLIIGADQAQAFTRWHRWREILELAQLAVAHRPDGASSELSWQNEHLRDVVHLKMPPLDVSATAIRQALAQAPASAQVQAPPALASSVLSYIDQHRLYSRQP
jgi:nicotinate-nucleotide adenylyltransferase